MATPRRVLSPDDINKRIDASLKANRRAENAAIVMAIGMFLLGVTILIAGFWHRNVYITSGTVLFQGILYWPIKQILRLRKENILLQTVPEIVAGLPFEEAVPVLLRLIDHQSPLLPLDPAANLAGKWEYRAEKNDRTYSYGGDVNIHMKMTAYGPQWKLTGTRRWEELNGKREDGLDYTWSTDWAAVTGNDEIKYTYTIEVTDKLPIRGFADGFITQRENGKPIRIDGTFYQLPPVEPMYGNYQFSRIQQVMTATDDAGRLTQRSQVAVQEPQAAGAQVESQPPIPEANKSKLQRGHPPQTSTTTGRKWLMWAFLVTVGILAVITWRYWFTPPPSIADITADLTEYVKHEYAAPLRGSVDGWHNAWSEADMRVALDGLGVGDDQDMWHWFEQQKLPCHCWRQQPDDVADHIGVTSWVLLTFALMHQRPSEDEVRFIVNNQHPLGWWPQFPSTDDAENASTYATAVSIWALYELFIRGLVPASEKESVNIAIQRGADWLVAHNVAGHFGHWADYQEGDFNVQSIGISGFVVHILHLIGRPARRVDQDWMASLPNSLPSSTDEATSSHAVDLPGGKFARDTLHSLALPWFVIGTVDAYSAGTALEKAKARSLLAEINRKGDEIRQAVQGKPWVAAEILISLRYFDSHISDLHP